MSSHRLTLEHPPPCYPHPFLCLLHQVLASASLLIFYCELRITVKGEGVEVCSLQSGWEEQVPLSLLHAISFCASSSMCFSRTPGGHA